MILAAAATPAPFSFSLPEAVVTTIAVVAVLYFVLPKWLRQRRAK